MVCIVMFEVMLLLVLFQFCFKFIFNVCMLYVGEWFVGCGCMNTMVMLIDDVAMVQER